MVIILQFSFTEHDWVVTGLLPRIQDTSKVDLQPESIAQHFQNPHFYLPVLEVK